jgi:hypothetical protein
MRTFSLSIVATSTFAHALLKIAPQWFSATWARSVTTDSSLLGKTNQCDMTGPLDRDR